MHQHPEGDEAVDHGRPILVFAATSATNHGEFRVEEHGEHFEPQRATQIRSKSDCHSSGQWHCRGSGAKRAWMMGGHG